VSDPAGSAAEAPDVTLPAFDSADYELRWPRDLFARELVLLRAVPVSRERRERIEFLLQEAFLGETPAQDFAVAADRPAYVDDPWGGPPPEPGLDADGYLDRLQANLPRLREHHEPAPYWPTRHGAHRATASLDSAKRRFAALINELHGRGYFGRALPPPCVDDYEPPDESAMLAERLGIPDLWPLRPDSWDEDTFFGLIEVFHDLAVRPRERNLHSYNGCGWHYSGFGTDTGRALYRWRINRLLTSAGIELRLAEAGEDVGRLVRVVDAGRADLIQRSLQAPDAAVAERVAHALAQFRGRAATMHDKRSAVLTLAGILEERRELIREKIGKKDEGALFSIANEFAIRHQRRGQQGDYDQVFLDWIFWWYLATIELTGRLLARQVDAEASA
jgi:hypothetical protein